MLASALQADCRLFVTEDLQDGREVAGMRIADTLRKGLRRW
jgi:predicted nucleic acid-binding protein